MTSAPVTPRSAGWPRCRATFSRSISPSSPRSARIRPAPPLLGVIAALSNALDLQVIAEGVETEYQAAVLTELGFALAQGYHYSDSHPVSELISDLNENQGRVGPGVTDRELGDGDSVAANGWVPLP
ncbi:EAL domain-containing protein [Nocardia gipuzkoensis]